jgi:hypothetical protein
MSPGVTYNTIAQQEGHCASCGVACMRAQLSWAASADGRLQKEEEARAAASAALEAEHRRRAKAASLPPEPALGEPCAALRIRLPDGMTHQRRFNATHTLQEVRAAAASDRPFGLFP